MGDFLAISILHDINSPLIFVGSVPLTMLGLTLAGVSGGRAFAAANLGLAAGMGAGIATLQVLEEPLYMAALIPGGLVYVGVRLSVTWLIARRGVS